MMTIGEGSEVEVSGNPKLDDRLKDVLRQTQGRDSYECIKVVLNGGKVTTDPKKTRDHITELRKPGWKQAADRDFHAAIKACKGDPSKIEVSERVDNNGGTRTVFTYHFEDGVSFIRRDVSLGGLPTVEIQIEGIHPTKNIELKMRYTEVK